MKLSVPEANFKKLTKIIANVQKKFEEEITLTELSTFFQPVIIDNEEWNIKIINVEISASIERGDWKYLGIIEKNKDIRIIKDFDSADPIPKSLYETQFVCDHCHKRKSRKTLCILKNKKTNEIKKVGKVCVQDYTSGCFSFIQVQKLTKLFSEIKKLETIGHFYVCSQYEKLDTILLSAIAIIDKYGYVKKDSVVDRPTVLRVKEHIQNFKHTYEKLDKEILYKKIQDVKTWIMQCTEDVQYVQNIKSLFVQKYVNIKYLNYVVSAYSFYLRRQKNTKKESPRSKHVGYIGEKVQISIDSFTCVYSGVTNYGGMFIYRFLDRDGNIFIWKTSRNIVGEYSMLIGKVKAHTIFNGHEQTELSKCKLL